MMGRLLVIHTGGVGDFICTFPALSVLAQTRTIEIAGLPERVALARAAGLAKKVHDLERTGFASVFSGPDERLRAFAAYFDEALVWMADDDGVIASGLREAGVSRVQCYPGIPPRDWDDHAAQWYGHCAEAAISLPYTAAFAANCQDLDVIIQPGSGSPKKNWPLVQFEELTVRLTEQGYRVRWCLGPAEEEWHRRPDALPAMSLEELAGVLAGARLFVGNDSGISHLAAATGCPTVAIFGSTNPAIWKPTGPRVHVVGGDTWPESSSVFKAAMSFLSD